MRKGIFHKSNLITYLGILSAVAAMLCAVQKKISPAMIFMMLSGICDLFDGRFARSFERSESEKKMGIELDSLSDVAGFLICPVIVAYGAGLHAWYNWIVFGCYVVAGVTRLAWFNVNAAENHTDVPVSYYQGLPVTYAAVIFPLFWIISLCLHGTILFVLYLLVMLAVAFLFVADINIPKPKKAGRVFFSILAAGGIAVYLLFL